MSSSILEIKGKRYKDIEKACSDYELNKHKLPYKLVLFRYRNGLTLEEAFNRPNKPLEINGKLYNTVVDACNDKELNIHGLNPRTIQRRVKRGLSARYAFLVPYFEEKEVEANGKIYTNIVDLLEDKEANKTGASYANVMHALYKGHSLQSVVGGIIKDNSILIQGKLYKSLYQASLDFNLNKHGLSYKTIRERRKNGTPVDELFDMERIYPKDVFKYNIKGKWYTSIEDACKDSELNVSKLSYSDVMMYISRGVSLDNVFKIPNRHKTLKSACNDPNLNIHGLSYRAVYMRMKEGMSLKEAFSKPSIRDAHIKVYDKVYSSLVEATKDKELNINRLSYTAVCDRLKAGMSIEDAFSRKNSNVVININIGGKQFSSLRDASKDPTINIHNISYGTLNTRYQRGWELEKIFLTPLKR